jgi:hypothetical protein
MLVELSATVTANVQHEEEWEEEGEGDEQVQYSLVVYHVTPGHLHPVF